MFSKVTETLVWSKKHIFPLYKNKKLQILLNTILVYKHIYIVILNSERSEEWIFLKSILWVVEFLRLLFMIGTLKDRDWPKMILYLKLFLKVMIKKQKFHNNYKCFKWLKMFTLEWIKLIHKQNQNRFWQLLREF